MPFKKGHNLRGRKKKADHLASMSHDDVEIQQGSIEDVFSGGFDGNVNNHNDMDNTSDSLFNAHFPAGRVRRSTKLFESEDDHDHHNDDGVTATVLKMKNSRAQMRVATD